MLARVAGFSPPKVCVGSDLTRLLFETYINEADRITIIGLRPEALPELLRRYPNVTAPAHLYPPMGFEEKMSEVRKIVDFVIANPARFVFLAVGSPRQEMVAYAIAATGAATGIGLCIGASLDFLSGEVKRAPRWMQTANLEWLHRLVTNPKLTRRYLIDCPSIIPLLVRSRLSAKRPG
jgi:exopolysaccharide biosynthesis WecB/TagA/CpsF family protein